MQKILTVWIASIIFAALAAAGCCGKYKQQVANLARDKALDERFTAPQRSLQRQPVFDCPF